jgi:hypothetical protein
VAAVLFAIARYFCKQFTTIRPDVAPAGGYLSVVTNFIKTAETEAALSLADSVHVAVTQ